MARLGDTVADLLARSQAAAHPAGSPALTPVAHPGANPGALRMEVHLPADLPPRAPLVVVLHGCGQTAAGYAAGAGWIELADRHGFALLCPAQVRANNAQGCFNWFEDGDTRRGAGEAASIAQMVDHALATWDLDPARVFVTGLSAGGAMAAVMLATYPERFAAGAVIAGLPYGAASGVSQALAAMRRPPALSARAWGDKVRAAAPAPARWPRVSIWRGDADATVAPSAADALALQWSDVHGASASALVTQDAGREVTTWRDAAGVAVVELHSLAGLGHGAPIAAGGVDGCGAAGPWILEAGVSSSREIARFWGLDARRGSGRTPGPKPQPAASAAPSTRRAAGQADVGEIIGRALRQAGLLR